jgi:dolichol-phosphate mannosyltransferase
MVYFVLPVYNEEKSLPALIVELRKLMQGTAYQIIAINDGSTDDSLNLLKRLQQEDLVIEGTLINMNIGSVFSMGIAKALTDSSGENDILVIMESDQTNSVTLVKELISVIENGGQDIAIASRYKKGGGYVNFPLLRRIFSFSANFLMRFYFPINNVRDYTIFFRAYRIATIKNAIKYFGRFGLIQSTGFVSNAELLVKLSFFTDRISEIPFVYDYSRKVGKSKLNTLRAINEYFVIISYLKIISRRLRAHNLSLSKRI